MAFITTSSLIGWKLSKFLTTRSLKRNSGTLSDCTWIRPKKLSALLRREESVPGAGAHATRTSSQKGLYRTQTHDYIRHGTITLFAALSYLEGTIISRTEESHTHLE